MAQNGGKIQFQVGVKKDEASFKSLKQSLQEIAKIKPTEFSGSIKELNEIKDTAKKVETALTNAFNPKINSINLKEFKQQLGNLNIDKIYKDFSQLGVQGQVAFSKVASSVLTTNLQLKETSSLIDSMGKTMVNTVKWGIASSVMNTFTQSVQSAFSYVEGLEKSLTSIRIVTGDSQQRMEAFAQSANKAAVELGRSTMDYTKASLTFYQQGLDDEAVAARTESVLKAQNITGAGAEMADYLTSVWNGYKVANEQAELYVDKLAAVADSSASDMSQLAIAMSKVASTANVMGVDVDQLNAQLATVVATTRMAPESVGTAFKTIYSRLNDISTGAEGAETSLGNYSSKMAELGFNVLDASGKLRDTGQVMEQIGGRWQDLTRQQQVYLAQTMGGQRQITQVMALFDNWSTYVDLLNTSLESEGTLTEKNSRYMESLGAKIEQLGAAGERVKDALINSDDLKGGVDALTNLVNLFANFIESIGGGTNALLAFGSIATQIFSGIIAKQINSYVINLQNAKNNLKEIEEAERRVAQQGENSFNKGQTKLYINDLKELHSVWSGLTNQQKLQQQERAKQISLLRGQAAVLRENQQQAQKFAEALTGQHKNFSGGGSLKLQTLIQNIKQNVNQAENALKDFFTHIENDTVDDTKIRNLADSVGRLVRSLGNNATKQQRDLAIYLDEIAQKGQEASLDLDILDDVLTKFFNTTKDKTAKLEFTIQPEEAKRGLQQVQQELEETKKKFKETNEEAKQFNSIKAFTNLVAGIGQIASGLNSLVNITKIWKNENLSAGEKILQTFTNLSFTLPMLINGLGSIVTLTVSKGAADAAAAGSTVAHTVAQQGLNIALSEGAKAALSFSASLLTNPVFLAAAATIGILAVSIYKLVEAYNKEAEAAEKAAKVAQDASKTYNDLKTSVDELKSSIEQLREQQTKLNDLTKGTQEWRDALQECNDQVLELISQYPELAQHVTNTNGQLSLNQEETDKFLAERQRGVQTAKNAMYLAQANARDAQAVADAASIAHNSSYLETRTTQTNTGAESETVAKIATAEQVTQVVKTIDNLIASGENVDNGLSGLTDKIVEETHYSNELVNAILKNEDSLLKLRSQLQKNEKADQVLYQGIAAAQLQNDDTYQSFDDLGKEFANKIASQGLQNSINSAQETLIDTMQNSIGRLADGTNATVQDILDRLNKAQTTNWEMDSNAVRGDAENRTLAFRDEQGQLRILTKEQIATTIATSEALQKLGASAQKAAKILSEINGNKDLSDGSKEAIQEFIAEGQITEASLKELQTTLSGSLTQILGEEVASQIAESTNRTLEELNNDWSNAVQTAITGFDNLKLNHSNEVNDSYDRLKETDIISKAGLDVHQMIVQDLSKAFAEGGQQGLNNLENFYSHIKDFDAFDTVVEDFDFASKSADDFGKALLDAGAISIEAYRKGSASFQTYIDTINAGTESLSPSEVYKNLHDVADKIKDGGTVDSEQIETLRQAGVNVDLFFQSAADGSFKLRGTAEDFITYINNISIQQFKQAIADVQEQLNTLGSFKNSKYSKENGGSWEDFSSTAESTDVGKVKAQLQFLQAIGIQDQYIRSVEKDIADNKINNVDNLEKISKLLEDHADDYNNLNFLQESILEKQQILNEQLEDASNITQEDVIDADVKKQDLETLTDYFSDYADKINEVSDQLKDNAEASEDVAQGILRYDAALASVIEKQDEWQKQLKSGSLQEQIQAGNELRNVYSDLLDLPYESLSPDFTQSVSNLELLKQAANGSEQAYEKLMQAAQQDILAQVKFDENSLSQFHTDLATIESTIDNGIDDLEIGAFVDDTEAIRAMNQLINAAEMTRDQATDLLASMGVDAEVESVNVPKDQKQAFISADADVTYEDVETATVVPFANGEQIINGSVKVPSIHYKPVTSQSTATSSETVTALRVKSAKKSSGGGFKFNNSSHGRGSVGTTARAPKTSSSPKKSGSNKTSTPKVKEHKKDDVDRYFKVNKELAKLSNTLKGVQSQQDKLLGKALTQNLNEQLKILNKQVKTQKEKLAIARGQQDYLKKTLQSGGARFDKNGSVKNYQDLLLDALKDYNKKVDEYNHLAADQQEQFANTTLKQAEERYNTLKKNLNRYGELWSNVIPGLENDITDTLDKQIELKIKKFNIKVELQLDMNKAKRDFNAFRKTVIDNIQKDDILGNARYNVADLNTYTKSNGTVAAASKQVQSILKELNTMDQGKRSKNYGDNRDQAVEDLKKYLDVLSDGMTKAQQIINELEDSMLDLIDEADQAFQKQVDQYEYVGELLNHDIELIQMLYGQDSYKELAKYYQKSEDNNNKELNFLRNQRDFWREKMQAEKKTRDSLSKGTVDWKKSNERFEKYREEWQKSLTDLNNKVTESIENIQAKYANSINLIFQKWEKGLTNNKGLDYIREEWQLINKQEETYLDNVNSIYAIEKLKSAYEKAISDNQGDLKAQRSLNQLMENQLKYLREKDKLSQYDVERANKILQIETKRLALEQTSQNKNQLRLRRDSQGNYTYEYTSNQEDMDQAKQSLADAENELYNITKQAQHNNLDTYYSLISQWQDKVKEVYLDTTLTVAQQNEKVALLNKYYGEMINNNLADNGQIRKNMTADVITAISGEYARDKDNFTEEQIRKLGISNNTLGKLAANYSQNSINYSDMVTANEAAFERLAGTQGRIISEQIVPYWTNGLSSMQEKMSGQGGFEESVDGSLGQIRDTTQQYQQDLGELETAAGINFENIKGGIDDNATATSDLASENENLTQTYDEQFDSLSQIIESVKQAKTQYDNLKQSYIDAAEKGYTYLTNLASHTDGVATSVDGLTRSLEWAEQAAGNLAYQLSQISVPDLSGVGGGGDWGGVEAPAEVPGSSSGDYSSDTPDDQYTIGYYGSNWSVLDMNGNPVATPNQGGSRQQVLQDLRKLNGGYDTGGYTGDWHSSEGKVALLHEKELVLNKKDTKNILDAVNIVRSIDNLLDRIGGNFNLPNLLSSVSTGDAYVSKGSLDQNVHIDAHFPNVNNHLEIEKAFDNLLNHASQFINR